MHRHAHLVALRAIVSALVLHAVVRGEILQVQVIHRHGAREHLSKNALNPGQENGASLLPMGGAQLRKLGKFLRERYILRKSMHRIRGSSPNFTSPLDAFSVSSNLDRTLSSARALLDGLYPVQASLIPTKVFSAKENDFRLRGYTLCPKFAAMVQSYTTSPAFRAREKKNRKFLDSVAAKVGETPSLANIFNIFDRHKLRRMTGNSGSISKAEWEKLKWLANEIESRKFRKVGGLVAGGMVGTMLRYAESMAKSENATTTHRFMAYSAHYPTLLGIFAALHNGPVPVFPANQIPEFAAALIWELHTGGKVHMLWYAGDPNMPLRPLPFRIAGCARAEDGCPLQKIRAALKGKGRIYDDAAPFCAGCGTDPTTTHVCAAGARLGNVSDATSAAKAGNVRGGCSVRRIRVSAGVLGGFIGMLFGSLIAMCAGYVVMRRKIRRLRLQMHMQNIGEREMQHSQESHRREGPKTPSMDIYIQTPTMDTYSQSEQEIGL